MSNLSFVDTWNCSVVVDVRPLETGSSWSPTRACRVRDCSGRREREVSDPPLFVSTN